MWCITYICNASNINQPHPLMATIKFYLKNQKNVDLKKIPLKIYVRFRLGRKVDFHASIKKSVFFNDWNEETQKVRSRNSIKDHTTINKLIKNIYDHFYIYDEANTTKGYTPSYKEVKEYYKTFFETSKEDPKKITLLAFIKSHIESKEAKQDITKGTIKTYKTTETILTLFNDKVYNIDFNDINLEFYNDFVEWCEEKKLSDNYIGKHIKVLKTFMNEANEKGLTDNKGHQNKNFKVKKEEANNIYLTDNELLALWNRDLSKNELQERARDLFLIGAYTGLRVSDYNNLTKQHIKKVNNIDMLHVKTRKTGKVVAIPLHPIVRQILIKNDWNAPEKLADQQINVLIKEVGFDAELDGIEYITQTKGGKKITTKKYKFELIKTHTARRSFCTNAFLSGMNAIDIMAISGHKTERAFLTYVKVTPEQTAIRMAEHPFFNNSKHLKVV